MEKAVYLANIVSKCSLLVPLKCLKLLALVVGVEGVLRINFVQKEIHALPQ